MEPTAETAPPTRPLVEPMNTPEAEKPDNLILELQRAAHTVINTRAKEIVTKIDAIPGETPAQIESKKVAFFQAYPEQEALYKAYKAHEETPNAELILPVNITTNFEPTSPTFALVQQYISSREPGYTLTPERRAQLKPVIENAAATEGIITTKQLTAIVDRYLVPEKLPEDTKSTEYTEAIQNNENRVKLKTMLTAELSKRILATPQDLATVLDLIGINDKAIQTNIASSTSIIGELTRARGNEDRTAAEIAEIDEGIALHTEALALYRQSAEAIKENRLPEYINRQMAGEIPVETAKAIAQSLEAGDPTPLMKYIVPDLPSTATPAEKEAHEKKRSTIQKILLSSGTGLGLLVLIGLLTKAKV